jgi:hypothetical protein
MDYPDVRGRDPAMMRPAGGAGNLRKLWIVLAVIAALTPVGIYLPELLKAGSAWGEWSIPEVEKMVGYAPKGMKRLSELWKAPMADYSLPGKDGTLSHPGVSYVLSAFLGAALCGGAAWLILRWLAGKKKRRL